jgi:uncharacterized repeat protein (TIGR01451 family)
MLRNLTRLLVAAIALSVVLLAAASFTGAAPGTDASVGAYDQCANGDPPSTSTACPENWINGILNEQNSHYAEDDVTPQRVVLDLPKDGPTTGRTVEISYLTRKGGVHAYDSLATWNHTQTTADRCANLSAADCVAGPATTFPIPLDGTVVADSNGAGSATSLHQLTGQVFTMYGGTITGVSAYTHDDAAGSSDSYAHITLTYSVPSLADDAKVMLLFGGHIAPSIGPRGWGVGVGAGSISGGPYHVRITAADGASVGNRDNQIMSGAIIAPANLLIKKVAVGGDGTFDYTSTGGITNPFTITTASGNGQVSFSSLSPGPYTVTESAEAGWDFTSLVCEDADGGTTVLGATANIDLDTGQTVTCTYTNTKRSTLVVYKQVVNDNGGTALASAWTMNVSGPTNLSFAGSATGVSNEVLPGSFTVGESGGPSGYALTYPTGGLPAGVAANDCNAQGQVSVGPGETKHCVLRNDDIGAKLIVIKHVINDDGGTAVAGDFQMTVDDPGTNPPSFPGAEAPGTEVGIDPGAYSVSEGGPAGYAATFSADCAGTIALGETKTCTVTNNDQAGTLIVIKHVVNDSGGSAVASAWTMNVAGPTALSFPGAEAPGTSNPVDAGAYKVTESGGPAGYALSYSGDCDADGDVTVPLGQTRTCTLTNNDQAGTLIVIKHVVNDSGGSAVASAWTMNVAGPTALSFPGAEAPGTSNPVDAGAYKVTESGGPAGYALSYSGDCDADGDVTVPLGQTRTCTLTNNDLPRGAINVTKTANPTSLKEPGGTVNFTVTIENTSQANVTINSVVDDKFGNLAAVAGGSPAGCFAVPFQLAPGQSSTCTFPKNVTGTAGGSHVNVVTASGVDEHGFPVSDSDDATVTFTERLIDLVVVKDATSPTPLNGTVNYTMTVTNKGPDTATNVQLVDPAPAGITYLTVNPGSPTCTLTPALITCNLGTLEANQSKSVTVTARATTVGSKTNTATTTGEGGRETNPADNTDTAVTVVPAPVQPPTPKPKPTYCLTLTVTPKMITADGKPDTVKVKTTAGPKRVKGTLVRIKGAGIKKSARSNARGIATLRVNPKRPGVLTITAVETKQQQVCGPRRIGAVGVFLPPLTG